MLHTDQPKLSVVIPTLGRPFVVRTLSSLVAAHGSERLEVFLVGTIRDPAMAGEIQRLVERHPRIQHLTLSFARGDSSEKKNAGARAARAEVVAFLDDDVIVAPDWPERITEPFDDPRVGLVSGPSLVPADISIAARLAGLALSSPAAGYVADRYRRRAAPPREVKWSQIIGCNMALRKAVLKEIGFFDPRFWPGEEMLASYRASQGGHRIIFHPQAVVEHYPRSSPAGFFRQMFGYGATRIRLIRSGVEIEPTPLAPGIWLLALVVLSSLALACHWAALVWFAGMGGYALFVLAITAATVAATRRLADAWLLAYIPLMHFGYGMGEWCELLAPNRDLSARSPETEAGPTRGRQSRRMRS